MCVVEAAAAHSIFFVKLPLAFILLFWTLDFFAVWTPTRDLFTLRVSSRAPTVHKGLVPGDRENLGDLVIVALSGGQCEYQTLEGTAGQNITLNLDADIKQSGDIQIIWSFGSDDRFLLSFDDGKLNTSDRQKFHLNLTTGGLIILHLSANDTGLYKAQTLNGKGPFHFNLTVDEAEQSHHENLRAHQRNHTAAVVSAGLFGLTCIVLLPCAVWIMRELPEQH